MSRLLGVDEQGVLDIGESKNLRKRLRALAACASADGVKGHMAGWRYRYLQLHEKLPGDLVVAWRYGDESYKLEAVTMTNYVNAFGELPPLNYQFNWRLVKSEQAVLVPAV
jgi:hypothetical protein